MPERSNSKRKFEHGTETPCMEPGCSSSDSEKYSLLVDTTADQIKKYRMLERVNAKIHEGAAAYSKRHPEIYQPHLAPPLKVEHFPKALSIRDFTDFKPPQLEFTITKNPYAELPPSEEPPSIVGGFEVTEEDKRKHRNFQCAEAALPHYNKKHSGKYKLVEATNSRGFLICRLWFHCFFKAAIDASSAPDVFFAELELLEVNKYKVMSATRIVDGTTKITYDDCEYCQGKMIPHPVNKFIRGNRHYGPPVLRPRCRLY